MADYKTYLAANVLNEEKIVSYRLLAREIKVTSNAAKKMLFDFRLKQNNKKPKSVHACYVIDGFLKSEPKPAANGEQADGEDIHMQSSPLMSSSMPQPDEEALSIMVRSITLVKEEDLEVVQNKYERITSAHVHSIGPSSIQNLEILSDCNRTITKNFISEDPLVYGRQYGVMQNNGVRRRKGRRPPGVVPVIPNSKPVTAPTKTKPETDSRPTSSKGTSQAPAPNTNRNARDKASTEEKAEKPAQPEKSSQQKPAGIKREKSDLMTAFGKSKPKLKPEDTASSVDSAAAQQKAPDVQIDESMKDASDEEEQEEDFMPGKATDDDAKGRKSQTERAEQLRKMMDEEDDEEMEDAAEEPGADDPVAEEDELEQPANPAEPSPEPPVTVSGGRRRGRRKVMKKKTIKDEEGYLVTKEEPAWESFSEDEPPPTKEKTPFSTASSAKGKKPGGKPGQGNIMSFFGKK